VRPVLGRYEMASHLPAPEDIGAVVTRLRRQSLESYDAAYVGNVILW
jgi:hypothetical protein